jgi:hypothetical protein
MRHCARYSLRGFFCFVKDCACVVWVHLLEVAQVLNEDWFGVCAGFVNDVDFDGCAASRTFEDVDDFVLVACEGTTAPLAEVVRVVGVWQVGGTAFTRYKASPQSSSKREGAKFSEF